MPNFTSLLSPFRPPPLRAARRPDREVGQRLLAGRAYPQPQEENGILAEALMDLGKTKPPALGGPQPSP